MPAITCDACGGNSLTMTDDGQFSVCDFCGTKHTLERIKVKVQEIKGVVEITKGEAEKERLLKNATTFLNLCEIEKAREMYIKITLDYPNDYRGWLGLFTIPLYHFSHSSIKELIECYAIENKIKTLTNKDITSEHWQSFYQTHCDHIDVLERRTKSTTNLSSDIVSEIDSFSSNLLVYNTDLLPEELKHLQHKLGEIYTEKLRKGEIFPFLIPKPFREFEKICMFRLNRDRNRYESAFLNDLWTEGQNVAIRINSLSKHNKNELYKQLGVPEGRYLGFLLGKTMLCVKPWDEGPDHDFLWLESNLIITVQELDNIVLRQTKTQRISDGLCEYCGGEFKGILKKVCTKCQRPKNY